MGIAQAPPAPRGHQQGLTGAGEIAQQDRGAGIANLRATGHLDHQGMAAGSGAAIRTALGAIVGGKQAPVMEIQQGLKVGIGLQQHIAAPSSIAAGGTSGWHIFLTAESHDAVAAAAGAHGDPCLIDELHG